MASYVDSVLTTGERIFYRGRISHWSLTHYYALGALLLPVFGLGLIFWLLAYVKWAGTELAITNKRIIAKFGFIRRDTIEIALNRAESVQVQQGIWGRLFDFGSITVSGAGAPQAPIPSISKPLAFRRAFIEAQELSQSYGDRYPSGQNGALAPGR